MDRLKCENTGEWIDLFNQFASGGEAELYKTSKPNFVAKKYRKPMTADTWAKLRLMVNNPPHDPTLNKGHISISWPKSVLVDNLGRPRGFLLPYIANTLEFSVIYHPGERKKKAPGFNWRYLHTTAKNIASVVESIHAKNYVIGDVNSRNFLVKANTCVSIIDTDSFQVKEPRTQKVYRCTVGVPEYQPREMLGRDFDSVDRYEVQDRFGLAILIWQLLFGAHPFSGKWNGRGDPPSLEEKISQGHWVYGASSMNVAVQITIDFKAIHPLLQNLFRRCFDDGNRNPNARPSAAEWRNVLEIAINDLQVCSVEGQQHYYARSYGRCYWCERKNQLGLDIFANPTGASITNIFSISSPTILKNYPIPKPPQPQILTSIGTATPPKTTSTQTKPSDRLIQWLELTWTRFRASKTQPWIAAGLFILIISIFGTCQSQIQKTASRSSSSQATAQNSDPKKTISRYYQLATTNRKEAIKLLSDDWRRREAKKINNGNDSWWSSVRKVEPYGFKTFAKNSRKAKIKVWLKYNMKNGRVACESLISNLIFKRGQWFIDTIEPNSVVQNPYCDAK